MSDNTTANAICTVVTLTFTAAAGFMFGKIITDAIDQKVSEMHQTKAYEALKKAFELNKVEEASDKKAEAMKWFKSEASYIAAKALDNMTTGHETFKLRFERAMNDYCKLLNGQKLV